MRLPRLVFGKPAVDNAIETWARAIESSLSMTAEPQGPVQIKQNDDGGRSLFLKRDTHYRVALSGAASPYTGAVVTGTSGGNWVAAGFSLSNVQEFNGLGGLGGKHVDVRAFGQDDWRFYYPRGYCKKSAITFTIQWCAVAPYPVNGVTITVKNGSGATVASGSTNSSGQFTTPALNCGSYTWTSTLTGWISDSGSVTLTGSGASVTSTAMTPSTLHFTDPLGTVAVNWGPGYAYTRTVSGAGNNLTGGCATPTCTGATVSATLQLGLACHIAAGVPGYNQNISATNCCNGTNTGWGWAATGLPCCNGNCVAQTPANAGWTLNPFNITFTTPANLACSSSPPLPTVGNPVAGTVTITL